MNIFTNLVQRVVDESKRSGTTIEGLRIHKIKANLEGKLVGAWWLYASLNLSEF